MKVYLTVAAGRSQIEQVESPPRHEGGQSCGHRHEGGSAIKSSERMQHPWGYVDAQENLKSGDVMGLWVDESQRAGQSSRAQQKTSLGSTGGHARQQQQQRWRVSLRWRPNGDGAANGSSAVFHRVFVDSSGQGGWRLEHRGRSLQKIEMFDLDRRYAAWTGVTILSAVVDIQAS